MTLPKKEKKSYLEIQQSRKRLPSTGTVDHLMVPADA
jgi:hypothetical protein